MAEATQVRAAVAFLRFVHGSLRRANASRSALLQPVRHPMHNTSQSSLPTIQRLATQSPQKFLHSVGKVHSIRSRCIHRRKTRRRYVFTMADPCYTEMTGFPDLF